ncbi:MAG: hypothetical protein MUF16_29710 [Burkholderiaceae bacterium]|jgi:hypothetical protein|nr:hypothetical protein [Burkholderiaceae bacterium]
MTFTVLFGVPAFLAFFLVILATMWAPAAVPLLAGLALLLGLLAVLAFVLEALGFLAGAARLLLRVPRD